MSLSKVIIIALRTLSMVALCLALWGFGHEINRSTNYMYNWPREPQQEVGRTIPHQARASVRVYISEEEAEYDRAVDAAFRTMILLSIILWLMGDGVQYMKRKRDARLAPPAGE